MQIPPVDMNKPPMHIVFRLRDTLRYNLEHVRATRRLTLDPSQPGRGFSGRYGLFGSLEWWNNIALGRMPLLRVSGTVERFQAAGPDRDGVHVLEVRALDGSLQAIEVHAAAATGLPVFQAGHVVSVLCALDELKRQPAADGGRNVAGIALEMAVVADTVASGEADTCGAGTLAPSSGPMSAPIERDA